MKREGRERVLVVVEKKDAKDSSLDGSGRAVTQRVASHVTHRDLVFQGFSSSSSCLHPFFSRSSSLARFIQSHPKGMTYDAKTKHHHYMVLPRSKKTRSRLRVVWYILTAIGTSNARSHNVRPKSACVSRFLQASNNRPFFMRQATSAE